MNQLVSTKQKVVAKGTEMWRKFTSRLPALTACMMLVMATLNMMAFCNGETARDTAFTAIFNVLKTITTIVGAIFLIVGIVRFIIAHANEDGPNQQKAAMLIATGIALIIIGPVLSQLIQVKDFVQLPDVTPSN